MRITQLSLPGQGAWRPLEIDTLHPQLNVFYGPPQAGKSTLAELISQLLYGKSSSTWRQQLGQLIPPVAGALTVVGPTPRPTDPSSPPQTPPRYVLRRDYDHSRNGPRGAEGAPRLTVAATDGSAVDEQTIPALLAGLPPTLAQQLYAVDFTEPPLLQALLSDTCMQQFTAPHSSPSTRPPANSSGPSRFSREELPDRRRIDELLAQRDAIAEQLREQVGVRCHESHVLEQELAELTTRLQQLGQQRQQLLTEQQANATQRSKIESRLRYLAWEVHSEHPASPLSPQQQQDLQTTLDTEIAHCRSELNHHQSQAHLLRGELAQLAPDGTADRITCLADGRASLGALENLLDDLDVEIAQGTPVDQAGQSLDWQARLQPLAGRMRQQVYTLCGQLSAQQQKIRRQQIMHELHQLERIQTSLGERLEQLQARREALLRQYQLAGQKMTDTPQSPVAEHCQCQHHGDFLAHTPSDTAATELRAQLTTLRGRHTELADALAALEATLTHLQAREKRLQSERAQLLGGAAIQRQQTELERLEGIIQSLLEQTPAAPTQPAAGSGSEFLARLSCGELTQIRLERKTRRLIIQDRHGQARSPEQLSTAQHDQLYLALNLALVDSHAHQGIRLPFLLDEPFLRQEGPGVVAMAHVLDEFSRAGHQVLVFTEDRTAERHWAARGTASFALERLRAPAVTSLPTPNHGAAPAKSSRLPQPDKQDTQPSRQTINRLETCTRLVRQTQDGHTTPALRLASVPGDATEDVFYLSEDSTWELFPVLGHTTHSLFAAIEIHTIGDLLRSRAKQIARRLDRPEINAETVRLWQYHMGLMCHIPALTLRDAQLLTAVGIHTPADLVTADLQTLWPAVQDFLASDRGRQLANGSRPCSRKRLRQWQAKANHYRSRWEAVRYPSWSTTHTAPPKPAEDKPRSTAQPDRTPPQKFLLDLTDDVEAAPAIGPKTAQRLARLGIHSVDEFLSAAAGATAKALDVGHISAKTITTWQHQARLVCQIPELPGYGAQLFVANGYTKPSHIAHADSNELVDQILAFCQTKEGQRILRSSDVPARSKIAHWIKSAAHHRPLAAA